MEHAAVAAHQVVHAQGGRVSYHRWWPRWLRKWWLRRTLRIAEQQRAALEADPTWYMFKDELPFKVIMEMARVSIIRLKAELLSLDPLQAGDELLATSEFVCPFCGGKCFTVEEPPSVAHVEPPCETFVKTEATEFVRIANAAVAQKN